MNAWNTPICCWSWMLKCAPRDFSSLLSILFCNAVPGVGGTVCGIFNDKNSKRRVGDGEVKKTPAAAPSRSAREPENTSTWSPSRSRSSSLLVLQGSDDFCFLIYRRLFNFDLLFLRETSTNIAWRLFSDTEVVSLARFSACGAIIVRIEWKTEVTAFRWCWLCTHLVWRHFCCNTEIGVETWKTHKTQILKEILILCNLKLCQKCLYNKKKQIAKIASEMPVPHSLGKYFQHHEI